MVSRTRVRQAGGGSDGIFKAWTGSNGKVDQVRTVQSFPDYSSTVTDQVGYRDQPFSVDTYFLSGHRLNARKVYPNTYTYELSNWPVDSSGMGLYTHISDPDRPSNPELAVQCLKRTNPSRSKIDLPVSIFELRDLPGMIRIGGKNLSKAANANLALEFGWKPFVGDLLKMIFFQEDVEKRVKLLKKFQDGKPLLRKVKLYESSVTDKPSGRSLQSTPFGVNGTMVGRTTKRTVWGYVTYVPTPQMDNLLRDDAALRSMARKIIGGMTADISNVYQALPWSWLVDWFSDLGDYLEAHRNLLPLVADSPRLCETTVTEVSISASVPILGPEYAFPVKHTRISKTRVIGSASFPSASLPFLTGRQVGILGSLAVIRGKGSYRF